MKFWRHVNLAILKIPYLAALKFSDFSLILKHKSLNFRAFNTRLKPWRIKVLKTFTKTIEHLCDKIINVNSFIFIKIMQTF